MIMKVRVVVVLHMSWHSRLVSARSSISHGERWPNKRLTTSTYGPYPYKYEKIFFLGINIMFIHQKIATSRPLVRINICAVILNASRKSIRKRQLIDRSYVSNFEERIPSEVRYESRLKQEHHWGGFLHLAKKY